MLASIQRATYKLLFVHLDYTFNRVPNLPIAITETQHSSESRLKVPDQMNTMWRYPFVAIYFKYLKNSPSPFRFRAGYN